LAGGPVRDVGQAVEAVAGELRLHSQERS
jgi:hypothetical protein